MLAFCILHFAVDFLWETAELVTKRNYIPSLWFWCVNLSYLWFHLLDLSWVYLLLIFMDMSLYSNMA